MMVSASTAHHICDSVLNGSAIVLNLVLLYTILMHTSSYIQAYRGVLLMTCVSDLVLSSVVFVGQPVLLFSKGYFLFVPNGFMAGWSHGFDYFTMVGFVSMMNMNMTCLAVQFVYRYLILRRHSGSRPRPRLEFVFLIVLPVTWNAVQVANTAWMLHQGDGFEEIGIEGLRNNRWPFESDKPPNIYGSHVTYWDTIGHLIIFLITSIGGYAVIVTCEYLILRRINKIGMTLTNQTKEMHKELNRALLALAAAPLFTLIVPVWFFLFCIATQASPGPISAFMACSLTLITIANPLSTLYFVKPYRYAIMSCVGWKKTTVAPTATVITGVLSRATTHHTADMPD